MRVVKGRVFNKNEDISKLLGPDGYDREPLTKHLDIKNNLSVRMFGSPNAHLCVLGFDFYTNEAIAFSLAAPLEEWLSEFAEKRSEE